MMLLASLAMVLFFLWPLRCHVRRLKMPGLLIEFEPRNYTDGEDGTPTKFAVPALEDQSAENRR